jgi:hypothetical protein
VRVRAFVEALQVFRVGLAGEAQQVWSQHTRLFHLEQVTTMVDLCVSYWAGRTFGPHRESGLGDCVPGVRASSRVSKQRFQACPGFRELAAGRIQSVIAPIKDKP